MVKHPGNPQKADRPLLQKLDQGPPQYRAVDQGVAQAAQDRPAWRGEKQALLRLRSTWPS